MITVVVVDKSAEGRKRIHQQLCLHLTADVQDIDVVPRINLIPLSLNEIKFRSAPDICIIGPELLTEDLSTAITIRKLLPHAQLVAWISPDRGGLGVIEQLARIGVDDVFAADITASEFLRKLILLARKGAVKGGGKLVLVDSGKGGLGVTSIVAALGEALAKQKHKVALLDLDSETQDLSRFLQAKPFVNENLHHLLDQTRPVTQEFVEQCVTSIWADEPLIGCVPPMPEIEGLWDSRSPYSRTFASVIEVLDSLFEVVVVDMASARGAIAKTIYRLADHAVFVVGCDPAGFFASLEKIRRVRCWMAADAKLSVVVNSPTAPGLSEVVVRREFERMLSVSGVEFAGAALPYCKVASRWPGSGRTLFTMGSESVAFNIEALCSTLGFAPPTKRLLPTLSRLSFWKRSTLANERGVKPQVLPLPTIQLPSPEERVVREGRAALLREEIVAGGFAQQSVAVGER